MPPMVFCFLSVLSHVELGSRIMPGVPSPSGLVDSSYQRVLLVVQRAQWGVVSPAGGWSSRPVHTLPLSHHTLSARGNTQTVNFISLHQYNIVETIFYTPSTRGQCIYPSTSFYCANIITMQPLHLYIHVISSYIYVTCSRKRYHLGVIDTMRKRV